MNTTSAAEIAHITGLSLPAVHRALDTLHVPPGRRGTPRSVSAETAAAIIAKRGSVPVRVAGRSRDSLLVLRALSHAPFGIASARGVARRAGIAPATASKLLAEAQQEGLAERRTTRTVMRGRVTDEERWYPTNVALWPTDLLQALKAVRLPAPQPSAPPKRVPEQFWHHFWNVDPRRLSVEDDAVFIASRLIDSSSAPETTWTLDTFDKAVIAKALARRGVDARTRALLRSSS